ncbi:hypothetical protein ABE10_01230, partial [Bacillus toyonensis]|nr:hypothetical protein [Bacillus toyonensis]
GRGLVPERGERVGHFLARLLPGEHPERALVERLDAGELEKPIDAAALGGVPERGGVGVGFLRLKAVRGDICPHVGGGGAELESELGALDTGRTGHGGPFSGG